MAESEIVLRLAKIMEKGNERGWTYEKIARAAIEAMREPTQEMTIEGLVGLTARIKEIQGPTQPVVDGQVLSDEEAAHRYMNLGALVRNGSEVNACWRAMVDAAIRQDSPNAPKT